MKRNVYIFPTVMSHISNEGIRLILNFSQLNKNKEYRHFKGYRIHVGIEEMYENVHQASYRFFSGFM